MMSRRRGNLFAGSYDEELREALATNPNFVQAPNFRGSYLGTSAEEAAPDASDPPYSPTAASAEGADTEPERADSRAPAACSLRRSKRKGPFYEDREAELASSSAARRPRETHELLTTRDPPRATTGARARLLLVQISPSSSDSEASAASTLASDDEFADDNFPPTYASSPRTYTMIPKSAANCASSVSTPRAHRRKQIRPYRCPVA